MNKQCFGAGLISLDILIKDDESSRPISYYVGGTCGNVMMILSYMGWDSFPIARLDNSKQTTRLLTDMKKFNVKTDFVTTDTGKTPVIIQHNIIDKDGKPTHKFEFKDSKGRFYLAFSPVTKKQAENVLCSLNQTPHVFFFDRVSPANIMMAKWMHEKGVLVYFEPSCKISTKGFWECVRYSDIVKFSNQRIEDVAPFNGIKDKLIIQTLGADGLRYRNKENSWRHLPTIHISDIVDTSGAGDWTSASLIYFLYHNEDVLSFCNVDWDDCLTMAQKIAALSCKYDGARGMMSRSWNDILSAIKYL